MWSTQFWKNPISIIQIGVGGIHRLYFIFQPIIETEKDVRVIWIGHVI